MEQSIADLYAKRPIRFDDLIAAMLASVANPTPEDLIAVREIALRERDFEGMILGIIAVQILPAWGPLGVKELTNIALTGWWSDVALPVLFALSAMNGDVMAVGRAPFTASFTVPPGTKVAAAAALQEIGIVAASDRAAFDKLYLSGWIARSGDERVFGQILNIMIGARLVVNEATLDAFQALLDRDDVPEEEVHQFIAKNPAILDPLAQRIWTKHELGDDFITDFVIRPASAPSLRVEAVPTSWASPRVEGRSADEETTRTP